jgi:hypothetical protein
LPLQLLASFSVIAFLIVHDTMSWPGCRVARMSMPGVKSTQLSQEDESIEKCTFFHSNPRRRRRRREV